MQSLNPHLCPNAQGWQYCDIKVLVGHVAWSLLYSLEKMGDLKAIPRGQRNGEKERSGAGPDVWFCLDFFPFWMTRLTWGLQQGLDLIWSSGIFSSRHIIGQGNKGPPAWRNWIRIGNRCESAMETSTAKTAAALQISPPFRWNHLQSLGKGADGKWTGGGRSKEIRRLVVVGVILMLVRLNTGVMGLRETPLCPEKKPPGAVKRRAAARETDRHTDRGREEKD